MTWTRKRVAVAVSAAAAVIALVAGVILVFGGGTPPGSKRVSGLVSPFTGEQAASLNQVLAARR